MTDLADLDISAGVHRRASATGTIAQHHDPYGFELADQTIDFLASYKGRDIGEIAKVGAWPRKAFRVLCASGYPHAIFLEAVDGVLR